MTDNKRFMSHDGSHFNQIFFEVLARALSDEHNAWLIFGTMKVGDAATCALFDGLPDWFSGWARVVVERRYPGNHKGYLTVFSIPMVQRNFPSNFFTSHEYIWIESSVPRNCCEKRSDPTVSQRSSETQIAVKQMLRKKLGMFLW